MENFDYVSFDKMMDKSLTRDLVLSMRWHAQVLLSLPQKAVPAA